MLGDETQKFGFHDQFTTQKLALWATILLLQQHIGCASVKRRVLNQFSLKKAKIRFYHYNIGISLQLNVTTMVNVSHY